MKHAFAIMTLLVAMVGTFLPRDHGTLVVIALAVFAISLFQRGKEISQFAWKVSAVASGYLFLGVLILPFASILALVFCILPSMVAIGALHLVMAARGMSNRRRLEHDEGVA